MALEAASRRIRVNPIHPGPISNGLMETLEEAVAPGTVPWFVSSWKLPSP
jgi:NAD(P)-dependent dehydrogenase (short-subunit alcohol dehydrogenase family)